MTDHPNRAPQPEVATGVELARHELERFVYSPGLDKLAVLYGVEQLPQDTQSRLKTLQGMAKTYWDYRKGAERQATLFDEKGELAQEGTPAWNTVFDAATELGQVESSKPKNQNPDYLVILGGANQAPEHRLLYGLESVKDFGTLVYMGSSRMVGNEERQKASSYLPEAFQTQERLTEYDLGRAAFETHLPGAKIVSRNEVVRNGDTWAWTEYQFEHEGKTKTAFVLNTPIEIHDNGAGAPSHRATTYDNYRFFASQAELASSPDVSVVAVTTGLYVPGQHLPAVQELTLPYGTRVETIGHNAAYNGGVRTPAIFLQEDKAAVDAAVRLQQAIDAQTADQ